MFGFDAVAGFAISDDGTKHVNPFRRVENLNTKDTNSIETTEVYHNSVVLFGSDNSATVLSDNKVK